MNSSPKVSILAIILMVFIALTADLLSLIPLVGTVVGPIFWAGVALYLWMKGFGFLNTRRLVPMVLSVAGEILPAIQALPTILAGTIVLIFMIKTQEKTGISMSGLAEGKIRTQNTRQTLNQNGVRQPSQSSTPESTRNANNQPLIVDGVRAPQK